MFLFCFFDKRSSMMCLFAQPVFALKSNQESRIKNFLSVTKTTTTSTNPCDLCTTSQFLSNHRNFLAKSCSFLFLGLDPYKKRGHACSKPNSLPWVVTMQKQHISHLLTNITVRRLCKASHDVLHENKGGKLGRAAVKSDISQ